MEEISSHPFHYPPCHWWGSVVTAKWDRRNLFVMAVIGTTCNSTPSTRTTTVALFPRSGAWHLYVIFIFQVNPLRQTQIYSEVNIVRYISRLFPLTSPYNYEATGTFTIITETDQLLDQLEQKLAAGDNKEQQSVLRLLNGRCGIRTIVCILMVYALIPPCIL